MKPSALRSNKISALPIAVLLWAVHIAALAQILAPPFCGYYVAPCPDQSDPPGCGDNGCTSCNGVPIFWVSSPYTSLRLEDVPLEWNPGTGGRIAFQLSYRQRGAIPEDATIFGLGPNWSCSFRAFVLDLGGSPDLLRSHRGGAGWITHTNGATQYRDGSILTSVTGGYQIEYASGAKDIFTHSFASGTNTYYFLSSRADPQGHTTTYNYSATPGIAQLVSLTDPDGKTCTLYYENATFTNQITKVVDPYSRTNLLRYDDQGYLTNVVDVFGLTNSFTYDPANPGWITAMTTPYGSTSFSYGGVNVGSTDFYTGNNQVNRWLQVTLPTGGHHLYLYRQDCSAFMASTYPSVPVTTPFGNTLDNLDQQNRNSFHWDPLQYSHLSTTDPTALTSADYLIGRLNHWLTNAASPDPSDTLSLERAPSPDGSTSGQITWYDYDAKSLGNNYIGTNSMPRFVALVLPDGSPRYTLYVRGAHSQVTTVISRYSKTDGSLGLRTNTFIYAANSIDVLQEVGPNNEQVVSNYFSVGNTFHQPDASYDALNQQTLYTYNANRELTGVLRPSGLTTTNLYFTSGSAVNRLQTTIDLEISRTNAFTYANDLVQSQTDERGLIITNFWDNLQRLTGMAYPDGSTVSNIYTALDQTAAKDRLGYWSYSGFNPLRQMVAATNANGVITRYGYCDCGTLFAVTNGWNTPVQQVTTFAYDYQGNRAYTYLPDATITNWFNALAQIYQTGDGRGTRYLSYNNQGLLTNVSNVYGRERATIYDNENRPLFVTDGNGVTITNAFDLLGRLLTRTYPDGGVEKFGYSARGVIAYTNQIGASNFFTLDPAGRKTFETNANNQLIRYTNNAAGDLLSLTDGKNQTTRWNYDHYGRVTNKLDQAGVQILVYSYDADDRLLSRWSAAKGTTYYTNDAVGNVIFINYPSSPDVTLRYDWLNRVTNMVDGVGTTLYTYTGGGQLFTEDSPFASDTVTNTYLNRLRTSLVLQQPTGLWTNGFIWDAAGRLTNVTSQAGSFGYQYLAPGPALIQKLLLPNGAYITNTFDNVARLLTNKLNNSSQTKLDSYAYMYNPANQRTNLTRADGSYYGFLYDKIGQLTVADSTVNAEDRGYVYDAAWNLNRRTNNGVVSTFNVDGDNQLTTEQCRDAYDSNGNLITRGECQAAANYSYDDENRLVSVSSGTVYRSDFSYDGRGRLRIRTDYTWNGTSWIASAITRYVYDGNRVIQERNSSNTPTVAYTRGNDLSGSLEGAGGIGGLLARSDGYSAGNWTNHNYYFADGNGNITYMVNNGQAMVASYRYDPFGNTISSSGSLSAANVYRFSSKGIHGSSGMYDYVYRFYDPNLQRWINRDPLGEQGFELVRRSKKGRSSDGPNLYTFLRNNPVSNLDPYGLFVVSEKCDCTPQEQDACETTCWPNGGTCTAFDYYWVSSPGDEGEFLFHTFICRCNPPRRYPPVDPIPVPVLPPSLYPIRKPLTPIFQCH